MVGGGMKARTLPDQHRGAPKGQLSASKHMYVVNILRESGRRGGTYRARFFINKGGAPVPLPLPPPPSLPNPAVKFSFASRVDKRRV